MPFKGHSFQGSSAELFGPKTPLHTQHCNVENTTPAICYSQHTYKSLSQVNADGQLCVFIHLLFKADDTGPAECVCVGRSTAQLHCVKIFVYVTLRLKALSLSTHIH